MATNYLTAHSFHPILLTFNLVECQNEKSFGKRKKSEKKVKKNLRLDTLSENVNNLLILCMRSV